MMTCPTCAGKGSHVEGIARNRRVVKTECPACRGRGEAPSNLDLWEKLQQVEILLLRGFGAAKAAKAATTPPPPARTCVGHETSHGVVYLEGPHSCHGDLERPRGERGGS
jgi:hypothetical protein